MKLGIVLTGITNGNGRDWKNNCVSVKEKIIDCWMLERHEVKLYLTTYDNSEIEELNEFFKPDKIQIVKFEGSHQRTTYYSSLFGLMNEDLDFIISTRFDIDFNESLFNYNFDMNKMNFIFRDNLDLWTRNRFVGDCLHGIPKVYLPYFLQALMIEHQANSWFMHGIYNRLIDMSFDTEKIHFLLEGNHSSNENSFYNLIRVKET
jgi:hypothetical protein